MVYKSEQNLSEKPSKQHFFTLEAVLTDPRINRVILGEDEWGVAVQRGLVHSLQNSCRFSPWDAPDARNFNSKVGFVPSNLREMSVFLGDIVYQKSIVAPRRQIIDSNNVLSKIVVVTFVTDGENLVIVPRKKDAKILPGLITLFPVMESLQPQDFAQVFTDWLEVNKLYGESPYALAADDILNTLNPSHLLEISHRGIYEEAPFLASGQILFSGFLGGGKDLGLVTCVKTEPAELNRMAEICQGRVIKASEHDYQNEVTRFEGSIDGWSYSVLKYFRS